MATTEEKINRNPSGSASLRNGKIDPKAPAGSEESLGAESVRDGRPATDDSVVEAMDEENPGAVE